MKINALLLVLHCQEVVVHVAHFNTPRTPRAHANEVPKQEVLQPQILSTSCDDDLGPNNEMDNKLSKPPPRSRAK